MARKDGGRDLASIENCLDVTKQGLNGYIKKSKEIQTTAAINTFDCIRTDRRTRKTKNNGKKKYCRDILNDKLGRFFTRRP